MPISKKMTIFAMVFLFLAGMGWSQETIQTRVEKMLRYPHVPQDVLVKFKDGVSELQKRELFGQAFDMHFACDIDQIEWVKSRLFSQDGKPNAAKVYCVKNPVQPLSTTLAKLLASSHVDYAEPNYLYKISVIPNDTSWANQWDKKRIYCPSAWNTRTAASSNIVIAVIDTGVLYTHPDLSGNMWTNPGEISGNGADDDGNGIIDDYYGANFTSWTGTATSGNPVDGHKHGTHCAGISAASGNNSAGVAGVCWSAKIMAVKVLSDGGSGATIDIAAGVDYAVSKGAKVMNLSLGGGGYSTTFYNALKNARAHGVIAVCAAGNDSLNNDVYPNYPSNYTLDNVVAVGSTQTYDVMSDFSNYRNRTVDLFAPGSSIYSTVLGNGYDYLSGTSMATPQVTGAMALVWSEYPGLTYLQLINHIYNTVDKFYQLEKYCVTDGRLNVASALTPPSVIAGFGLNQGGVQVYQYSDTSSPAREPVEISSTRPGEPLGKTIPAFQRRMVRMETTQAETESVSEIAEREEEIEARFQLTGDSRALGWTQIANYKTTAVALVDLNNDNHPEAIIASGATVYVYSIADRKTVNTVSAGVGNVSKIVPVLWKDTDESSTVFKDIVMVGPTGIAIWRQKPTVKLTKIFTGPVVDATYTKSSSGTYPTTIMFSVEGKGMYQYLMGSSGGFLWQFHSATGRCMAPFKRSNGIVDFVMALPGFGICRYDMEKDDGTILLEYSKLPTALCAANLDASGDDELIGYFPDFKGVYARRSGVWEQISAEECVAIGKTNMNYDTREEFVLGFKNPQNIYRLFHDGTQWQRLGLETRAYESMGTCQK